MRLSWIVLLVGCYRPQPPEGAPCARDNDCPSPLQCDQDVCTAHPIDASGSIDMIGDSALIDPDARPAPPGALGYWALDDGAGTQAKDSSGNNHDGLLEKAPMWTTGKIGGALAFDGVSNSVDLGDLAATNGASVLSVSAWVMQSSLSVSRSAVSKFAGVKGHFALYASNQTDGGADDVAVDLGNSIGAYTTSNLHAANRWEHWAFVFDGTQPTTEQLKIFFNGVQQPVTLHGVIPRTLPSTTTPVRIGADGNNAAFWNGLVDDVRIYPRALSAFEMSQLALP